MELPSETQGRDEEGCGDVSRLIRRGGKIRRPSLGQVCICTHKHMSSVIWTDFNQNLAPIYVTPRLLLLLVEVPLSGTDVKTSFSSCTTCCAPIAFSFTVPFSASKAAFLCLIVSGERLGQCSSEGVKVVRGRAATAEMLGQCAVAICGPLPIVPANDGGDGGMLIVRGGPVNIVPASAV
jgi:hypothetical protein